MPEVTPSVAHSAITPLVEIVAPNFSDPTKDSFNRSFKPDLYKAHMVSVRPVTASDFEQVYPLLDWHDPDLGKIGWQRIFDYAWQHDEPHCGYGLFDEDEAIGFLGFIFQRSHHFRTEGKILQPHHLGRQTPIPWS